MSKQKKEEEKGSSKKKTKASDTKPEHDKQEDSSLKGKIGIGIPVDEETYRKMKEDAKKLED